jgi:hypothetical protein
MITMTQKDEKSNRIRTDIREISRLSTNVVGSLQNCKLSAVEDLLTSKIEAIDEHKCTSETVTHRNNLRGLRAVLQELLCTIYNINIKRDIRHSFMPFDEALALFLSFNPDQTAESLKDHHLKKFFREILCHPKHGLPVYVIGDQYVLLRSQDVDLEVFIEELLVKSKSGCF